MIDLSTPILSEAKWPIYESLWTIDKEGRVYAAFDYSGYRIQVWKPYGQPDRVIEKKHVSQKRNAEELELSTHLYQGITRRIPECKLEISEYSKDIIAIFIRENGNLWVISGEGSHKHPKGSIGTFDIFDTHGRFTHQVSLMGEGNPLTDGYFFGTVPELMVDPDHQRQGIGRRLMELAWENSPTSLFFGAQPGNEAFFEKLGYERSLASFARRKPRPT